MELSTMDCSALTRSDLHLIEMHGQIEELDGLVVARNPDNPGRYWSNFLLLERTPEASELEHRLEQARRIFDEMEGNQHLLLRWDGDPLDTEAEARASKLGLRWDGGLEMRAAELEDVTTEKIRVQPLDLQRDWEAILRLNRLCDSTEGSGDASYDDFKAGVRRAWKAWNATTWWGAFIGQEMVGQCGMVLCPGQMGRFQAVETHPGFRRRGVCSTLISTVGRHVLHREGCREVLLGADLEGPALALYQRLGFQKGQRQNGLVQGGARMVIRSEQSGDRAEVRSITDAAFGQPGESALIESLREEEGVLSLVATQAGGLQGHALFSPVHGTSRSGQPLQAIALGPVSVRPTQQQRGIGSALIREGLDRCRAAGWSAVFVLGDPKYYGRFGWQSASSWGLHCQWTVGEGDFQAMELEDGALESWHGRVDYHPNFDTFA
jgi:putative acetyltransferase